MSNLSGTVVELWTDTAYGMSMSCTSLVPDPPISLGRLICPECYPTLEEVLAALEERKIDWGEPFEIRQVHLTPEEIKEYTLTRKREWIVLAPDVASIFETNSMGFGPAGGW